MGSKEMELFASLNLVRDFRELTLVYCVVRNAVQEMKSLSEGTLKSSTSDVATGQIHSHETSRGVWCRRRADSTLARAWKMSMHPLLIAQGTNL